MYEQARLKALEELTIELLRVALDRLIDQASEPLRFCFRDDDSAEAQAVRDYQSTVRAAKRQRLTRAKHPGGLLSEEELAELGENCLGRRPRPEPPSPRSAPSTRLTQR